MWVRMGKIIATVLHEEHERQVEEAMDALEEGPEGLYKSHLADLTSHKPSEAPDLLLLSPIKSAQVRGYGCG